MSERAEEDKPVVHWQRVGGPLRADTVMRPVAGALFALGFAYLLVSALSETTVPLSNGGYDSTGQYVRERAGTVTCGPLWGPDPGAPAATSRDSTDSDVGNVALADICDRIRDRATARSIVLAVPTVLLGALALRPR